MQVLQTLRQQFVGPAVVKLSVCIKSYDICRIDKRKTKISRHDPAVQVFTAGRHVIDTDALTDLFFDRLKFLCEIQIQAQALYNGIIPGTYMLDDFGVLLPLAGCIPESIQQVRDLAVRRIPFAGCRRDHIPAVFFRPYDIPDFLKLFCTGK